MAKRRQIVLAAGAIALLAFLPAAASAGGGGSLPPPGATAGAGRGTEYCCQSWTPRVIGNGNNAVTVFDGSACLSINDDAAQRNSATCSAGGKTAAKCRGEFFTPTAIVGTGNVSRCLSP